MFPVLFTFNKFTISSFGLFLILSLILFIFLVWKIAKTYDVNEEKTLDILFLSFIGAFLFSRVVQILSNYPAYNNILKMVLINKFPGLSIWGALIGGLLTLKIFYQKFKLNFWQIGDFVIVGFFAAASLT